MQVRLYLRMLQSGWWIIALAALAALVLGLTQSYLSTPMYRATARFLISPNNNLMTSRDVVTSLTALDKRVIASTYAEVLNSDRIYINTSEALQIDSSILRSYKLSAVVLPEASVLELSASGPNPKIAALLANNAGQQGIDYILSIYQVYSITVLDAALSPTQPYSPNPTRDAGLALAVGLAMGAMLAVARGYLRAPLEFLTRQVTVDAESSAYTRSHALRRVDEISKETNEKVAIGIVRLNGLVDMPTPLPKPVQQRVLRHVASTLRKELRGRDLIGRWSNYSFIAILPHTADNDAQQVMSRVNMLLQQPAVLTEDETLSLNPQSGIAIYTVGEPITLLTTRIEAVLEQAKESSTNTIISATASA